MAVSPPLRDVAAPLTAASRVAGVGIGRRGTEWIVDARGCDVDLLRDGSRLRSLFDRLIEDLRLTPVAPAVWHTFPHPGGMTGMVVLAESHLACHTFPEFGSLCLNVFCCRARADFDAAGLMAEMLGATETRVRRVERDYGPVEPRQA